MTDTSLIGPYRVVRRLGSGGMGEVFLAEDPRLGRNVALKRPFDDWLKTPQAAERLRREARAAARLNHPNIAAVYDVLDVESRPHIVMEYVEGETLAEILRRGPVPPARAIEIGLQLTDALVDAHAQGVVHRDLKPGNAILTPGGRVKVLDFGVAHVAPAQGSNTAALTEPGRAFGTPGYAAPEQMLGERSDERSDIYSVGVVLFELLTGQLPFQAEDAVGRTLASLAKTNRPRADVVNPSVPSALADVVSRAMARDAGDRYQTALDLHHALVRAKGTLSELPTTGPGAPVPVQVPLPARRWPVRRVWLTAGLAVVAIVIAGWVFGRPWFFSARPIRPASDMAVIAVLPFQNLTGDTANDALAVGFADSLVTDLSRLPDVTVIRRDEVQRELGGKRDPAAVARILGADLIVDSSLQRAGADLRVNVTVRRADAANVWSSDFQGTTSGVFDLQRRLADGLIAGATLLGAGQQLAPTPGTSDVAALTGYWQGRFLLDRPDVPGNLQKAIDALESAAARDPAFALAHAALGEAALLQYKVTKDQRWIERALKESDKAVEQDPSIADVYVSRAAVYRETGRTDEAIKALQHAIAIQPTNDSAQEVLGETLANAGKMDEAVSHLREAIRLRPRFARHYDRLGVVYLRAGQFDAAIEPLQKETELQPDNAAAFHKLGTAYQLKGDDQTALKYYAEAIKVQPLSQTFLNMGVIQYKEGEYADAARSFEQGVRLKANEPLGHYNLGDAYRHLGKPELARQQYQTSIQQAEDALKVNASDTAMMSLAAVCLAKLGRFAEAARRADAAVALSPKSGQVAFRQATVLALAGRSADALGALDRALANGYSPKLAAVDEDLQSVRSLPGFRAVLQKYPS